MKISIIIPAYNSEKTIDRTLKSIINQTYKNLEIIIINDGSKDNTRKICELYKNKDSRIKLINNDNHGVSFSRNYGISISTGDYVTFVDADDTLELDCYESLIGILENKYDMVRYNFNVVGGKSFNNNLYELSESLVNLDSDGVTKVLQYFLISTPKQIPNFSPLLLIKKELLDGVKFNEKLRMLEDVNFYYDLFLNANNIYFSNLKKYNYYVNSNSVTLSPTNYEKNILSILETNKEIIKKCKIYNNNLIKNVNYNHLRIISEYLLKIYLSSDKSLENILITLYSNNTFKDLLHFSAGYSRLKNKIIIVLLKFKSVLLIKIYFKILKKLYIIKNKKG